MFTGEEMNTSFYKNMKVTVVLYFFCYANVQKSPCRSKSFIFLDLLISCAEKNEPVKLSSKT